MKYFIIILSIFFVCALAVYLFMFRGYETIGQLSLRQQKLSNIWSTSWSLSTIVLPVDSWASLWIQDVWSWWFDNSINSQTTETIQIGQDTTAGLDQSSSLQDLQTWQQNQVINTQTIDTKLTSQDSLDQEEQPSLSVSPSQLSDSNSSPSAEDAEFEQVQTLIQDLLE